MSYVLPAAPSGAGTGGKTEHRMAPARLLGKWSPWPWRRLFERLRGARARTVS
ncbi:hypothetical protein [Sciscionella sediminilitoris]|uniref:hypothetical protein n=1 Tax=Sciscionella sediminilitoris TaxID=1445613 RepID=UPI0012E0F87B|nr:hypothetical protein [Sciscionella sp. SE31]